MEFKTYSSPHLPGSNSVTIMMRRVLMALLPGIVCFTWLFGWGIVVNILLASLTALLAEAAILALRKRPVTTLLDGSALVTGVLLALALPPLTPWWIPVIGSLFAIVIAKQLYGGLGYNPFNPAMAGYVVLLISFPLELTLWSAPGAYPGFTDTLIHAFAGNVPADQPLDALSMATPMDSIKTRLGLSETLSEIH
ncbi:MAG: electron transport complex subunit RsxD, partial [Gammaproteobacteria bacterium]